MNDQHQADDIKQRRAGAVKTALVLGAIAAIIFATFVGSAIIGR